MKDYAYDFSTAEEARKRGAFQIAGRMAGHLALDIFNNATNTCTDSRCKHKPKCSKSKVENSKCRVQCALAAEKFFWAGEVLEEGEHFDEAFVAYSNAESVYPLEGSEDELNKYKSAMERLREYSV